ncbi:peptidoglycan-recognition protein 2 [Anoplophora glabripennis]|nr:peptidoglycan-recognition protein 2 [Anoplophora glabripennis]
MGFVLAVAACVAVLVIALPCYTNGACPTIITREEWNATDPKIKENLKEDPPPYVVVHHSVTNTCKTTADCKALMRSVQDYHMNTNDWEDIGYNFLIGNDGNIYEGRGWGIHGAHAIPYNSRSLGICLIGNFEDNKPQNNQLKALKKLIECSVEENKLTTDYRLIGHSQATATLCPGKYLFEEIKTWSHFDNNPE